MEGGRGMGRGCAWGGVERGGGISQRVHRRLQVWRGWLVAGVVCAWEGGEGRGGAYVQICLPCCHKSTGPFFVSDSARHWPAPALACLPALLSLPALQRVRHQAGEGAGPQAALPGAGGWVGGWDPQAAAVRAGVGWQQQQRATCGCACLALPGILDWRGPVGASAVPARVLSGSPQPHVCCSAGCTPTSLSPASCTAV